MNPTRAEPSEDDQEFLDRVAEHCFALVEEGKSVSVDELLDGRDHLRADVEELIRVAREVSVGDFVEPPRAVPGYSIIRELGRGGMGSVHLARQESLGNRIVALKVLPPSAAISGRARERFRSEANAIAKLRHPNIVSVYDLIDAPGVQAFAMEWVDGQPLSQLIEELRPSGAATTMDDVRRILGGPDGTPDAASYPVFVCRIGIAIARALAAVHEKGFLHRDVKPSNILLRRDGTPLLSDFGLARESDDAATTRTGAFVGTLAYAAPEQLRGDSGLDARADVYSLGATLYQALTFRAPFGGDGTVTMLRQIEAGDAPPIRRLNPRLAVDLETIVGKAMRTDREARYAGAAELADDLERLLDLQPILARPAGLATRSLKLIRRNKRGVVGALIGSVLTLALAALFVVYRFVAPQWVAADVAAARVALLRPTQGNEILTAIGAAEAGRGEGAESSRNPPALVEALADYGAALRLSPFDAALRLEQDSVRLANALLAGSTQANDLARDLEGRAPFAAHFAASRLGEDSGTGFGAERLAAADNTDLRCLGLIAMLVGDVDVALDAWSRFDAKGDSDPLVLAALGKLYLARSSPAQAYPRLEKAVQAFPDVGFLCVDLADAALQCGDFEKSELLLERARHMKTLDPERGLERVEADLFAATGRGDAAVEQYSRLVHLFDNPIARIHLARLLESRGELTEALAELEDSLDRGWASESVRTSLVQLADRWWAALPGDERSRLVRDTLDDPERRGGLLRTLRAYATCVSSETRDRAPARVTSERLDAVGERMRVSDSTRWAHWRLYSKPMKDLLVLAWLSDEPDAGTRVVEVLVRTGRAALAFEEWLRPVPASALGTFRGLGDLPGGRHRSTAVALSADGTSVVGDGDSASGEEAFRWRDEIGMIALGHLPGFERSSHALGVSADGSVVVGAAAHDAWGRREMAFRWTRGTGMVALGDLPGSIVLSVATAVTAD
ncbi:MAG: protein kinase [Planctomycetes bacterium]|nr:protein kinase [Planctomycetota bacterium]